MMRAGTTYVGMIAEAFPFRSQQTTHMRMHIRDMATSRALVREMAIREALGRWASELEPVLVYNHEGRFCGLTHAGQPLGALVPIHVGVKGGMAI